MKYQNNSHNHIPKKLKSKFLTRLGVLAIVLASICIITGCQENPQNNNQENTQSPSQESTLSHSQESTQSQEANRDTINLYKDTLKLADGDVMQYHLYASNGDPVDMQIYKMTDYLVAYQNVNEDYKYFGFAFYNLDNEKEYVLEAKDLRNNLENRGSITTKIEKKSADFTSLHDAATEYANSGRVTEDAEEAPTVEKVKDTLFKVSYVKIWGDEVTTFFMDIDDETYLTIKVTCYTTLAGEAELKEIKETLQIFENLKINLVEGKDESADSQDDTASDKNTYSVDERFKYYFAFKDIDTKAFNKDLAPKDLHGYNGEEITSLPITYQKLSEKYKPYAEHKSRYSNGYVETSEVGKGKIHWGISRDEQYLCTQFYGKDVRPIEEAMAEHNFVVAIGRHSYEKNLGIENSSKKHDIDFIVETFGNPNEIYIDSEITAKEEKADYWLVYNYNDYLLAFNFTESSNKDRSKQSNTYIQPYFEGAYYIDGNSFENGINAIKSDIYENYYETNIDVIVK